nr:hypothetical protein [Brevibacillus laterosporus]
MEPLRTQRIRTDRLIRFAETDKPKHLHMVSTMSVCSSVIPDVITGKLVSFRLSSK